MKKGEGGCVWSGQGDREDIWQGVKERIWEGGELSCNTGVSGSTLEI